MVLASLNILENHEPDAIWVDETIRLYVDYKFQLSSTSEDFLHELVVHRLFISNLEVIQRVLLLLQVRDALPALTHANPRRQVDVDYCHLPLLDLEVLLV